MITAEKTRIATTANLHPFKSIPGVTIPSFERRRRTPGISNPSPSPRDIQKRKERYREMFIMGEMEGVEKERRTWIMYGRKRKETATPR